MNVFFHEIFHVNSLDHLKIFQTDSEMKRFSEWTP